MYAQFGREADSLGGCCKVFIWYISEVADLVEFSCNADIHGRGRAPVPGLLLPLVFKPIHARQTVGPGETLMMVLEPRPGLA